MTHIQTFHHTDLGFKVQCVCVDGEPWFRGEDVATILGYTNTAEAIDGFDDDDLKSLRELNPDLVPQYMDDFYAQADDSGAGAPSCPEGATQKRSACGDLFISVYGLCSLVHRSKKQDADEFRRWVWSDIIHVVRRKANCAPPGNCSNDDEESTCSEDSMVGREEEDDEESLCSRLIKYIHKAYPDAEVMVGHGEHQRVNGYLKGWQSGIVVIRKLQNGLPDVFAINLDQSYETVVIVLHEHYKEVCKGAKSPVEDDEEEWYDFATNSNPKYWLRKLKNKTALMKECDKRGVIIDNPMMTLNVKIIEALIAADTI